MEDYALNMSHLALPDCLVERANRQQPTASDHVTVVLLAGDDYASHMHMLRVANPKAAQERVRFAQDVSAAHGPETLEQGLPAGLTQTEEKRVDTHELDTPSARRRRDPSSRVMGNRPFCHRYDHTLAVVRGTTPQV
eukprot:scaffold12197_cov36-Phaeocystis_antarctica.AAC.1